MSWRVRVTEHYRIGHLDDAHVLLTGVTGFLGQAALERLLSSYPNTHISVLIRRRGRQSAEQRFAALLRKPVFGRWREIMGDDGVAEALAERVRVIEGDLGSVTLPADVDVAIHAASTVSFDPPVDEAFRTNVSGVVTLYEALTASGADPHVVHISTAYVAGLRKGVVSEAPLEHQVDWRRELDMALAAREDVERDSRRPEMLRQALHEAQSEHAKAGPASATKASEDARLEWINDRLVEYGRTRAQTLGWPDVYTFTKALGERVAEELWGASGRLSIVRPAIVESALRHPYPGWIDGFKMADPLILAYGRGILREFPGLPDSVLDVIPVDLVANAALAVAGTSPQPGRPAYFHINSGSRNPLRFREMYRHVREYFARHPFPDGARGHVKAPVWQFPGTQRVDLMLRTGEKAVSLARKALLRLPSTGRTQEWVDSLDRESQNLEFLRRYSDLYGAYTRAEVIYDDRELRRLHLALPPERAGEHGFDPAMIDWQHYLQEVHCPEVTALARRRDARPARRRSPAAGTSAQPALTGGNDVAAVFDLEGTIVASNAVESYLWAKLSSLPASGWAGELLEVARSAPRYLQAEHRDRGEFIRAFLRRYEGASAAELRAQVDELLSDALLQRVIPEAVRQVRKHRAAGHHTVLITGAIEELIEPLRVLFDEVVAARMEVAADGSFTGFLEAPPLADEARAAWLRRHAADTGIDLDRSYAYADSYSDRPLLESVGHPIAVNPDPELYRHAKRKHWRTYRWGEHTQGRLDALIDTLRSDVRVTPVRGGLR